MSRGMLKGQNVTDGSRTGAGKITFDLKLKSRTLTYQSKERPPNFLKKEEGGGGNVLPLIYEAHSALFGI